MTPTLNIDKSNWKKYRFDEVCRQVNESSKNPAEDGLVHVIGLEHIEPNNLHITQWDTLEKETTFTRKFVKGQVLFGRRRAYQRKVAYAEFDGICSGDILVFEAIKDKMVPELLPFLIQSDGFFSKAMETSAGSLSPRTKFKELADYDFLLPPLAEQQRLAELLWAADEMIEKEKKELEGVERMLQSQIHATYCKSSTNAEKLGNYISVKSGFAFPLKYQGHKDLPIPFFKVADMNAPENARSMTRSNNYIDDKILNAIKAQLYPAGCLVFPKIGATIYTDKKRVLSVPSVVDNNIMVLVPDEKKLDADYLFYFFYTFKLESLINIGAVPTISAQTVKDIDIPIVSLTEQRNIVKEILKIEDCKKNSVCQITKSQEVKQEIINKIF